MCLAVTLARRPRDVLDVCSQHYNVAVPLSALDGSCMNSVPCSLQVLQRGICAHAFPHS